MAGEIARKAIEKKRDFFEALARDIWAHPETAFHEVETARLAAEAVDEVYQRLCRVAQGAALMTDTKVEIQFVGGCHETLPNMTVAQLLYEALKAVDAPVWSEEELRFAETLNEQSPSYREAKVQGKLETPIATGILPLTPHNGYGSTDVAEVMHIVPCAELDTATANRLAGATTGK